jgi:hypothetical protein
VALSINIGTALTLQIAGREPRIKGDFIGMKQDAYLIVEIAEDSVWKNLSKGAQLIVRYVYLGNIYGFRSVVLTSLDNPSKLIYLSFPTSIENHSLRKKQRACCYIPVKAKVVETEVDGVILDISSDGCKFAVKCAQNSICHFLQVEDEITVFLPFFGTETLEKIQAVVRYCIEEPEKKILGLQFKDASQKIVSLIDKYIEEVREFI